MEKVQYNFDKIWYMDRGAFSSTDIRVQVVKGALKLEVGWSNKNLKAAFSP